MANGKSININFITIYGLVDINDNIKYIGVTSREPSYRFNNHIYEAKNFPDRNKRTRWISSNDFKIKQIILDKVPEDEWKFWEQHWISMVKTWSFTLVNSNNGGGGTLSRDKKFSKWLSDRNKGNTYRLGKKHTDKSKTKMREKAIGRSGSNKGKVFSKEWKLKLSVAKIGKESPRKGVKLSEEVLNKMRVKVIQLTLDCEIIKEWNSVTEAGNTLGINKGHITNVCKGNRKTTGGFKWKYNG